MGTWRCSDVVVHDGAAAVSLSQTFYITFSIIADCSLPLSSLDTYLHTVYHQTWSSVELFVANMTLKVPRLLVLNQNFFIIKLTVAIPAPRLQRLLLLSTHFSRGVIGFKELESGEK